MKVMVIAIFKEKKKVAVMASHDSDKFEGIFIDSKDASKNITWQLKDEGYKLGQVYDYVKVTKSLTK